MKIRDVEPEVELNLEERKTASMMEAGFEDKIKLPSKFLPYDFKELYIRPFSTREVEMLESITARRIHLELPDLVNKVISPKVAYDLTTGDWWYVLIWLRVNTFGSTPLTLSWECPKCQKDNVTPLDLTSIELKELPKEYKEPVYINMGNKVEVAVRLPRVRDDKEIEDYLEKIYGADVEIPAGERNACRTANLIVGSGSLYNKLETYYDLAPEKSQKIKDFKKLFSHGASNSLTSKCEECGSDHQNRFTFLISDLLPSGTDGTDLRDAIRFG